MKIKTILFDLDGTLLDTAPDLAAALNEMLIRHQRSPLPYANIRPVASHGSRGLLHLGFNITENDPEFADRVQEYLTIYNRHLCQQTQPFPGVTELLHYLTSRKLQWGIVTNKLAWLTEPLLTHLGLLEKTTCVVSGDTLTKRKPDPAPLLHACELLTSNPAECVYIGDAQRDIEAGKRAGMHTLVALYGYIAATDHPETWGADDMVQNATEIIAWLNR